MTCHSSTLLIGFVHACTEPNGSQLHQTTTTYDRV